MTSTPIFWELFNELSSQKVPRRILLVSFVNVSKLRVIGMLCFQWFKVKKSKNILTR
jgi:hypothetical protein